MSKEDNLMKKGRYAPLFHSNSLGKSKRENNDLNRRPPLSLALTQTLALVPAAHHAAEEFFHGGFLYFISFGNVKFISWELSPFDF